MQASIEVKRRILLSTPHMGGKRLKRLVRLHARQGNMNSFIADLESRLDRFLYRCNAVPSIFAARAMCGHRHVMVNGKVCIKTHTVLEPGDIVEPAPNSMHIFKRLMKRRLANNTFVFRKEGGPPQPRKPFGPRAVNANREALLRDGALVARSYRRLPLPLDPMAVSEEEGSRGAVGCAELSSEAAQAWPAARQAQLDVIVPSVLGALAAEGSALGAEMATRRGELSVRAAAQAHGAAAPPATLAWMPPGAAEEGASAVLALDRVALRRLLLGLLAIKSG